ncbi:putative putative dimethyladenosine transferase [Taeniopygia guttata]|uniref:Putative putative dimethyladenosine transferase n=1 Tax=Taeniopygia guttata TaxID=59729 RepID=B5FXH6_TAEGU|nr:putative putative dimethyladenosine transferase [Taeniopygia guttata]ACH43737.1 putative putative dimethyladenosine transferase [Taeniopygia guttata]
MRYVRPAADRAERGRAGPSPIGRGRGETGRAGPNRAELLPCPRRGPGSGPSAGKAAPAASSSTPGPGSTS